MTRSAVTLHLRTQVELQQKLTRNYLPTGIASFDALTGGIPRGTITEIYGEASCGKTAFLHAFLSYASQQGEFCSLVDATNAFDPATADKAGADLKRLLWIRCTDAIQALKSADLLVHSGGWGVVVLDLGDVPSKMMQKLPISYWYRFRRAVENTPAAFVVLEREPFVKNCAAMALELSPAHPQWLGRHKDFKVLCDIDVKVTPRKPAGTQPSSFYARALA